jgi:hypothetical protein
MRTASGIAVAAVSLVGTLVSPGPAAAQSVITGVVFDGRTSTPVAGARLSVRSSEGASVTRNDGTFRLLVATAGRFILETRHDAYPTRTDTLVIADGETAIVEIRLVAAAIELPPITVQTRSRRLDDAGFYSRRERGIGVFVTRAEIAERKGRHMSDVLSRLAGLRRRIVSDGNSRIDSRSGMLIGRRCEIQYFIDGVRSELDATAIDAIPVEVVEGIEVYRGASEVPMQFDSGRAMCGVVVVWTRAG